MNQRLAIAVLVVVAGCTRSVLAETDADAVNWTYDAKVTTTTLPGVAAGSHCQGMLQRDRDDAVAHFSMKCGDRVLYFGSGAFKLVVRDPTKREDDSLAYDDDKTSNDDGTPGSRVNVDNAKAVGERGTITVWDVATTDRVAFSMSLVL